MSEPIATWNRARGVWETNRTNLLCGHSEPYSATWPTSGSMRTGIAFPLLTSAPRTSGGVPSSSPGLPTPRARDWKRGGKDGLEEALSLSASALLPTPWATDGTKGGPNQRGSSGDLMLPSAALTLLPTPRASPNENRQTTRTPSQESGKHGLNLATEACLIEREREDGGMIKLLPTPRTTDGNGAGAHGTGGPDLRTTIKTLTSTGDRTPSQSADGSA